MSDDEGVEIQIVPGPTVVLQRIRNIETFEVLASDLDALDDQVAQENQSLGFATAMGGIAVSTIVAGATAASLSPTATAIYVVVSSLASVATAWFTLTWRRVRRARPRLLDKIRAHRMLK